MKDIVLLEWTFKPKNFFEENFVIKRKNYKIIITDGNVKACINPTAYDPEHKMRDILHEKLNNRFLGVQLLTHKKYELSKASIYKLHPDGRKDKTVIGSGGIKYSGGSDVVVKDKNGNIISDSLKDRIKKEYKFSDLAEKYCPKNHVAASLFASYNAAVNDSANEFIHLFEIREALLKYFSDKKKALKALNLNKSDWSRIGQLANSEPVNQGRHRGKNACNLRDATIGELNDARKIARSFIEAYLFYIDSLT